MLESLSKTGEEQDDEYLTAFSILAAFLAVLGAATAAGLTMGLMSLDSLDLLVLAESDPDDCRDPEEKAELEEEKKDASILLPLIEDHHRLLVSLLLLNSVCAEALPIFLDELVPSSVAVLLGVFFLLVFGEILPSAIFTGPTGMKTSARLSPIVRILLFTLAPIAIPVGRFLDWWVGDEEEKVYNRSQLLALLRLHAGKTAGKLITVRQSRMMQGAMDLMHVTAQEAMTPVDHRFMLSTEQELNLTTLAEIVGKGYSRIPVYEKSNRNRVRGVLLTKTLAVVNPNDNMLVGQLFARVCGCVTPQMSLYDVLAVMKATKSHICLVTDDPIRLNRYMRRTKSTERVEPPKLLGCLSLHDIISCVVASDIGDEFSSRRPKRERIHSDVSTSDDDALDHNNNGDLESINTTPKLEFKSEFARERVMRWLERARLSAKLHQEMDLKRASSQMQSRSFGTFEGSERSVTNTESTPFTSRHDETNSQAKSTALARRLLSSWLVKRASNSGKTAGHVNKTLEHLKPIQQTQSRYIKQEILSSHQSSQHQHQHHLKRSLVKPPDSDDDPV